MEDRSSGVREKLESRPQAVTFEIDIDYSASTYQSAIQVDITIPLMPFIFATDRRALVLIS